MEQNEIVPLPLLKKCGHKREHPKQVSRKVSGDAHAKQLTELSSDGHVFSNGDDYFYIPWNARPDRN